MRIRTNKIADLRFDTRENILYVQFLADAVLSEQSLREHYEMIRDITEDKEYVALIDVSKNYLLDIEGFMFAAETVADHRNLKAAAFCSPTLINRLQLMQLHSRARPPFPSCIFTSCDDAMNWLRTKPYQN